MGWWDKLLRRKTHSPLDGLQYRMAFKLYSDDGAREVEVREFRDGPVYLVERELREGTTFIDRHSGRMVGPFNSPEDAEKFIVATAWFNGDDAQRPPSPQTPL